MVNQYPKMLLVEKFQVKKLNPNGNINFILLKSININNISDNCCISWFAYIRG